MTTLAELTTLRVGGPARSVVDADDVAEFLAAVRDADAAGDPLLVLGGGSNVLVADGGFDGIVVRDRRREVQVEPQGEDVVVTATAGVVWDDLVARTVAEGWAGIAALSGIPGSVGATPVQNVGAYGQEISEVFESMTAWDRVGQRLQRCTRDDLDFDYRTSRLKRTLLGVTPRWVVVDVRLRLARSPVSRPLRYAQLADELDVAVGDPAPLAEVRAAVLALRRAKGMVLDPDDHDTWSAGSFFTNPILSAARAAELPPEAPRYPHGPDGDVKTSAAWLIQHAGFGPGHGLPGPAALSTRHTLAITNRGTATASDLVHLAGTIRAGVEDAFGVTLVAEPMLIGTSLTT